VFILSEIGIYGFAEPKNAQDAKLLAPVIFMLSQRVNLKIISRDDVKEILLKWEADIISASDVHEWASNRYAVDEYDFSDWEGDYDFSVTNEVLGELDCLDMNLVTK
jgi:hypothetical protein